jgi:uncharacterized LabA/DUF88 family protein
MTNQASKTDVFAYIDGANLFNGVRDQGWLLDYKRFRVWLRERLGVTKAQLFIGLDPRQSVLYERLQEFGYILVLKPTITDFNGKIKGNCDADMVLHIVKDVYELDAKAVVVTSDGDFYSVVELLQQKERLLRIVSPSPKCSILLKRTNAPITYVNEIKNNVELKKPPAKTKHRKGLYRGNL